MQLNDYTSITELPTSTLTPDQIHRFVHRYEYARKLGQGGRVLEVACGAGSALTYLAQAASQVVGMDYTQGVLGYARQATKTPLVQADAQTLPFGGEHFDLVICFEAIYYLADYRRFLQESWRVLAPGGRLLICQSNPNWPNFVPGAMSHYYPPLPELATSVRKAGFGEVRCFGILPIQQSSARQRVINQVRRWVTQSGILPLLGPLKGILQQMSYGRLDPLPLTIDAAWMAQWQVDLGQTPVTPLKVDQTHRVIYVEAVK